MTPKKETTLGGRPEGIEPTLLARKRTCCKPAVYSVQEAREFMKLSRNMMYQLVRDRRIPSIRFGRKILIPVDALERLLNEV